MIMHHEAYFLNLFNETYAGVRLLCKRVLIAIKVGHFYEK